MPIKLNGATNGSVELDVPAAVGSDLQVTLPATAGEVVVKDSSGNITTTGDATFGGQVAAVANNASGTESAIKAVQTNVNGYALWVGSGESTRTAYILPNGSATFTGEISSGTSSASLFTRNYSGGSPNIVGGFRAQHEGVDKAVIFADGSSTFTRVKAQAPDNYVWEGYDSGNNLTSSITPAGSAMFAGTITLSTDLVVTPGGNAGLFWKDGSSNQYGFYKVGDGLMWRSFDTSKKLIGRVGNTGGVQLTNGSSAWSAYVSESRLKDIVGDPDEVQCWNLVRDIELKRYFYKDNDEEFRKGTSYMGPMADWLEEQDPELVIYNTPDEEGPIRTYNQGLLDMKALQALSTALARIETLETKVAALEATP
ncbi:endosialidase [uncultured phage_MedDCM-OCT-S45-C4]|uniref:Endosialidase n=1 Tax=uncultured phage_MedDCM-OCT-S45-C4 TaxID=2740801 RepID=A0A6S4P9E6_9CAUD|nr:endosialidase [uncultured phage_MedDCM-OCT-S45-C4]BAQ93965.1 endosialidase [uncultured phage_MedDCM-OCT-S45-C4]